MKTKTEEDGATEEQCPHKGTEEVGADISLHQDSYVVTATYS